MTKIQKLAESHPLIETDYLIKAPLSSWVILFNSKLGDWRIGTDINLGPQIIGFLIEKLTSAILENFTKGEYIPGGEMEKDIVCKSNEEYSFEIKTSSSRNSIYGNRSYAKSTKSKGKSKDGFYLVVNFSHKTEDKGITLIRFGYLAHSDWKAQTAESGQQARILPETMVNNFIVLYEKG